MVNYEIYYDSDLLRSATKQEKDKVFNQKMKDFLHLVRFLEKEDILISWNIEKCHINEKYYTDMWFTINTRTELFESKPFQAVSLKSVYPYYKGQDAMISKSFIQEG